MQIMTGAAVRQKNLWIPEKDPIMRKKCKKNQQEYAYVSVYGLPSLRAARTGDSETKQKSCLDSAEYEYSNNYGKRIMEFRDSRTGLHNWANGDPGIHVLRSRPHLFTERGIYACCPASAENGRCIKEIQLQTWDQCKCLTWFRFEKGDDAFMDLMTGVDEE